MKSLGFLRAAIIFGMLILLAGCGTTVGRTEQITLGQKDIGGALSTREIRLKSLSLEEDGTRLIAIAVFRWGEFSREDLQTLDSSLQSSLRGVRETGELKSPPLTVEVVVRRHIVATSNGAAAALACVAWRARLNDDTLYEEQFYASASSRIIATVGSVKDEVNKRIVSRIVRSAVLLSNGQTAPTALPISSEGTYLLLMDAIDTLPKSLTSTQPTSLTGNTLRTGGSKTGKVPWSWALPTVPVRWEIPGTSN